MKELLTPQNWSSYFFTITQVEYLLIKGGDPYFRIISSTFKGVWGIS